MIDDILGINVNVYDILLYYAIIFQCMIRMNNLYLNMSE